MDLYQSGQMMKHVGAYAGRRVILLMPDQSDFNYVMLIEIERLPHSLEEIILREVSSPLAQQNIWFALALHGVQYDGVNMIQFLMKTAGAITRAEASQVLMIPSPGAQFRLTDFYEQMIMSEPQLVNAYSAWKAGDNNKLTPSPAPKEPELVPNALHNDAVEATEGNRAIARSLLIQAKMLQADADAKFEEAYKYDPSLRPAETESEGWVDSVTGKTYKTEAALKAVISRRENAKD